jgi:NitT/TauT family transport system substrate-binding protein
MAKIGHRFLGAAVGAVALMALGNGWLDGPASAAELKHVTVRLGFNYNAHRSAYLLGIDKGFYSDVGLDVSVLEGHGFTSSMQLVANKEDTFAIVDPPSLMLAVAQGMPLRMVAQIYQRSPNAVISWDEANIQAPKDLVGKTVSTLQGDTTTTMLFALLAKNHVDRNEVKIFAADGGTRNQVFLSKRAEAITGFSNDSYLGFKGANPNVRYFLYSDYGINTMGDGVAANVDTIKSSPDMVRGFVEATVRAYKYALAHPDESVDALLKRTTTTSRDVEIAKVVATRDLVNSPDTETHGFGYNSPAAWQSAETLMLDFGGLTKKAENIGDYFTNDFLPKK